MIPYPKIDPIAFSVGPLDIRWYGLMYLVGFTLGYLLARHRAGQPGSGWTEQQVSDLIFYTCCGVVFGARIGYIIFYDMGSIINDPLRLFRVWEGGMSFHGGLIGVFIGVAWFSKKYKKHLFDVMDYTAPLGPLGICAGRIGNFINNELWGKVTDVPWAMVPYPGSLPRHPSQLYEAFLEGIVLFFIVWLFSSKKRPPLAVSGVFFGGYGCFRFLVEFVREPDAHLGYLAFGWLTMGQILSLPMIVIGVALLVKAYGFSTHGNNHGAKQT